MLEIHEVGWSVPIPDPKQHDDICLSMYFTFAERMELVQEVLRVSNPISVFCSVLTIIDLKANL